MKKTVCNMCGKDFDMWDEQEEFGFHHHVGYGSRFDEAHIDVDLCCECFDNLMMSYILPKCKYSPIEEDGYYDRKSAEECAVAEPETNHALHAEHME